MKLYILNLYSDCDYEIFEEIGVFDSKEKVIEVMEELEPKLEEEFKLCYGCVELNKIYDYDIKKYYKEEV